MGDNMKLFKFYIEYQVSLTGTWLSTAGFYYSKKEAQNQIKAIKKGNTIYRDGLKYRVKSN